MMPELRPELRAGNPVLRQDATSQPLRFLLITTAQITGRSKAGSAHARPHSGESVSSSRFGTTQQLVADTWLDYGLCSRHVYFRNFIFRCAKLPWRGWVCHTTTLRMVA